jgi:hypothetical protein
MKTFEEWMDQVDKLGIAQGIFDPPGTVFLCQGSRPRRPNKGEDGLFFELFQSGVPVEYAIGEALVADE